MDAALGFLFCMITLGLVLLACAYAYRHRSLIKRWLNAPYYAEDDRRLRLKRRIEDAEKELAELDKIEAETES